MAIIFGTSANDTITPLGVSPGVTGGIPSDEADSILGGFGADTIDAGGGDDTVVGEAGWDSILGGPGADTIDGGDGDDSLIGNGGSDWIIGGLGDDWLRGRGYGDTLDGGDGDDRLLGGNAVFGGGDSDKIVIGSIEFVTIDGGTGADRLKVAADLDLDFTNSIGRHAVAGRVTGIEALDLRGGSHAVTLDVDSVLALGSETGKLKVLGDDSDTVNLSSGFTASGQQVRGARTFTVFKDGGATVWVDEAARVDIEGLPRPGVIELAGLNGANGFVINGINAHDQSGWSVSGAGDVNGDGFADVIIGAIGANPNGVYNAGQSYVVFGSGDPFDPAFELSDLDGGNGFKLNGIDERDLSGISVSGAGDVNGDGYDDVIIGALDADPNGVHNAGESYVVFGSGEPFSASIELADLDGGNGFVLNGIDADDASSLPVSGAGDVNGDGYDDVIIGAHLAEPNGKFRAGESYVVFGSGDPFSASIELADLDGGNGFKLNGVDAGDYAGSVSGAGDVNGDGYDDLIIGAGGADPNDNNYAGESYVVFGSGEPFDATFELAKLDGGNGFKVSGSAGSGAGAGDVNGDGLDDIIIGGNENYVIFGSTDPFEPIFDLLTLNGTNGFVINGDGFSISGAGDVNGDGYDDVIIGAENASPNGKDSAGESYVVFGSSDPVDAVIALADLDGTNGFRLYGIDIESQSGWSVSGASDVNNDGFDDLIIAAPFAGPDSRYNAGESYVVFGAADIGAGGAVTADLGADLNVDDPLLL